MATARQIPSCFTVPFVVHSTFRDYEGRQLLPRGLEWGMNGDSHLSFLPANDVTEQIDIHDPQVRRGIVEAQNRWSFAKHYDFKNVDDILSLSNSSDAKHGVSVRWKHTPTQIVTETRRQNVIRLIQDDKAADKNGYPAEVWINGEFVSVLNGPETLAPVLQAISRIKSLKVSFKRSDGFIRIERYFTGGLRDRVQVFDHIMDNLIALEDPQALDDCTLIGTATLPDWIMGGNLTSRLWIQELNNGNILFLRPLYNDDINTSDRRFELVKGEDDEQIRQVQVELKRLRMLASISHPLVLPETASNGPMSNVTKKLGLYRTHCKVFGL
jgi:hypothetical protein